MAKPIPERKPLWTLKQQETTGVAD